jgi:hypothetical protein
MRPKPTGKLKRKSKYLKPGCAKLDKERHNLKLGFSISVMISRGTVRQLAACRFSGLILVLVLVVIWWWR